MRQQELRELIRPILDEEGFELVECSVARSSRSQTFRISIDSEGGVPIEACARISRRIAFALDANPLIRGSYQMEVSSAGMNRPIWSPGHFRRFRGEQVQVELADAAEGAKMVRGEIGPVEDDDDAVHIVGPRGEDRVVRFESIGRARIHLDPWKRPAAGRPERGGSGEEDGESAETKESARSSGSDGRRHGH